MPSKYQVSEKVRDKRTGKVRTVHYYLRSAPSKVLANIVANEKTKPKLKQKCMNELIRRNKW